MSLLRHYFSDKRVRQRCKMLRFDIVPVLCLIFGLLVQSPKIVKADPQHGVAFPDGKHKKQQTNKNNKRSSRP